MSIEFTKESAIRDHVLKSVSIALALFVLVVASSNFFLSKDYALGSLEVLISLILFHVYYETKRGFSLSWQPLLLATVITGGLIYGFANAKPQAAIIMWVFVLPPLYQLLFNRFIGSLFTFAMLGATALFYFPNLFSEGVYPFAFVNFVIPYSMIWLISFNHESVRIGVKERLEQLARTDALTSAFNRLALQQDALNTLHHSPADYLLHFDLDWFKTVNDTYGHSIGDQVLKEVVSETQRVLPSGKVYRIGGEEFCVIFEAENFEDATTKADELKESIAEMAISKGNHHIKVTISGGLIELSSLGMTEQLDDALQRTDKALYKAKQSGRNLIVAA
ncbi:GGDEF domain-containing protein [Vibrio sp. Isolate34]|uniref:GGDEF domain-containing protein n=1 Tax=Vibrio sp. Isolate34 TaxID=2908540 RepID=UPI001EFD3629|nr:GGDEF domain-containing protein [Vibrio sp. Isolate34]MCG9641029.1 GGDEF domain-containing protein [Vibrio sp. Isolate34]